MRYFEKISNVFDWASRRIDYGLDTLKHKAEVYTQARKLGVPVIQAAMHDMNKFFPSQFGPYSDYFFGDKSDSEVKNRFKQAANLHKFKNKHHALATGDLEYLNSAPIEDFMEMIADWYAAAKRAKYYPSNFPSLRDWLIINQDNLIKQLGRARYEYALLKVNSD